jgi:Dna[CI] antecedent DciA-like protein
MDLELGGRSWQKLIYDIAGDDNRDFVTLAFGWKKIVGKILDQKAELHKIEKNVLFVSVSNNVWMQEFILRKFQILQDVKAILHIALKDIVFFIEAEEKRGKLKWIKQSRP